MRRKSIIKKSLQEKIVFTIAFILFAVYAFTIFYAFAFMILSALKTNEEFVLHMFDLPEKWLFGNFIAAFGKLQVRRTNMWGIMWTFSRWKKERRRRRSRRFWTK